MGFSDFLGNGHIVAALRGARRAERVPHALLFTGPRGVGKFTLPLAGAKGEEGALKLADALAEGLLSRLVRAQMRP